MKHLRRLLVAAMLFATVMMLSACGNKEETVTYYNKLEEEGVIIEEWMTLYAKGDEVYRIGDTMIVDYSSHDEATQEMMTELYTGLADAYKAVEGVECTGEEGEGSYTISFSFEVSKDTLSALSENGLFEVSEGAEAVSLKATKTQLETNGYTVSEK
ncbi:MAG: DUF1307 domain-containing protein [Lachnospiraceae bacterium]|nr:DUF1307 domain-containing protein [Lachnospiraceae bacterium]